MPLTHESYIRTRINLVELAPITPVMYTEYRALASPDPATNNGVGSKGSAGTSLTRQPIPVYVAPARPSHPAVAVVEMPVYALQGEQFFVGALFGHSTGVDDDDAVGVTNSAEAVRNDEGSATGSQAFQGLLYQRFGFVIERGGWLIHNQDFGLVQEHARDGDALALPSREALTAFVQRRFEDKWL